jgi:hypothetical protein
MPLINQQRFVVASNIPLSIHLPKLLLHLSLELPLPCTIAIHSATVTIVCGIQLHPCVIVWQGVSESPHLLTDQHCPQQLWASKIK